MSFKNRSEHSPPHIRGAKLVTFFRLANKTCIFFQINCVIQHPLHSKVIPRQAQNRLSQKSWYSLNKPDILQYHRDKGG